MGMNAGAGVCIYIYMFSRLGTQVSYIVIVCLRVCTVWVCCIGSGFSFFSSPTTSVPYTIMYFHVATYGLWVGIYAGCTCMCTKVSLPYLNIPVGRNVIVCRESLASLQSPPLFLLDTSCGHHRSSICTYRSDMACICAYCT